MTTLLHWWHMGGYAGYVWSSYAIGFVVLGFNILKAKKSHQQVMHFEK